MTIVNATRSAWTQANSAAGRLQVFGGRVLVADSATPTATDWHVWPDGAMIDVTANRWVKAVDVTTTWLVYQAI
jgi:hypothetical protein